MTDFAAARHTMVARHLAARGIADPAVLEAMDTVPRERFVRAIDAGSAYADHPLPIGDGQTISQPYIVALMTEAIEPAPGQRVLEIGTGSGYAAAVLARIVDRVVTVERFESLARGAAACLAGLGFDNVEVHAGDGTLGWPDDAPYDGIVVTAGGPDVPPALLAQLAVGGRLVAPVGPSLDLQQLVLVHRIDDEHLQRENLGAVAFVPLVGEQGWAEGRPRR